MSERNEKFVVTLELFLRRDEQPETCAERVEMDDEVTRDVATRLDAIMGRAPIGDATVEFVHMTSAKRVP